MIASTNLVELIVAEFFPLFLSTCDALGNVGRLFIKGNKNRATVGGETIIGIDVANLRDFFAGDLNIVDVRFGTNFASNQH